ncbi:MAG TPA: alpha/beta fold hydrolase [Roseiarcus sp.]|jgi:poly(3-hydroxyalkanoate) synthetase|nr:alpha/beta fold hydrolase [Roseiarcus sp.]
MVDPFELWRLAWASAVSRGFLRLADFIPGSIDRPEPLVPSDLPVFGRVRLDLATMQLLEEREPGGRQTTAALIVAPFALHEASIADFAEAHSLAQALAEGGSGPLALTYWKSANADMRDFGIDVYLGDLNVAIDDLGGRVSLVGLCQGGWLAAAYAARFPAKVAKLALAGAPIDLDAAPSDITRRLASIPSEMIANVVALGGGRISGSLSVALWSGELSPEVTAEWALQSAGDPAMTARFRTWSLRTVDLPGAYFMQAAEWIFRENRLARGRFIALGRPVALSAISAPIFVLAAADDEVVPLAQATSVQSLCRPTRVETRVEPGRHLSLFMGRKIVGGAWRDIGRWLAEQEGETVAPCRKRRRKRQ